MHLACTLHITWEYHFWYTWTILFSKIYHMLGLSGTLSYAVFVYLCIFVFVFLYLRFWHMGISFLIYLNNPLFKNILHVGSFWHFVICCICVFVCLCICVFVFGLGRSLLDQFGQKNASPLSSTFWFESSKPSYLFKSVLLLQPYSIWVGGLAPVFFRRPFFSSTLHLYLLIFSLSLFLNWAVLNVGRWNTKLNTLLPVAVKLPQLSLNVTSRLLFVTLGWKICFPDICTWI